MPLILDADMGGMEGSAMQVNLDDVDDLFGDGVPLALPARPTSRRLRQRIDELRGRGCCRGLAWSKSGTIASIAADGQSLQLRSLRADPTDGNWGLNEPKTISPWQNLFGGPVVHLTWSTANNELAVIDAVGRVFILNFNADLNRPTTTRKWDADPVDDLHSVVGTYWLSTLPSSNTRFHPVYTPAVKRGEGTDYHIEVTGTPTMGPSHPNPSKSALVCITTNGLLKMFWSQNNNKQEETTLELESVTSADDLVTHAAICPDKMQSIFIAMATTSRQLRIVRVSINFNTPKPENHQANPPGGTGLVPVLLRRNVALTSFFQTGNGESHLDASMAKISHIELLPASLNFQDRAWSPIMVVTVRTYVPEPELPYDQEVQSIIDRWELLIDQKQALHPAFDKLGSRRNPSGSAPTPEPILKRLDPVIVNKIVVGVQAVTFGKVLCFTYSDGSVEYRDRFTMAELYREVNLNQIHSILETGFSLSGEPSCLQMAFSPSNFSLVQMYEDGQIKWHNMEYTLGDIATVNDANLSAVNAGIIISTAASHANGAALDDILAVARKFAFKIGGVPKAPVSLKYLKLILRPEFAAKWMGKMVELTRATVDYSEDIPHDHLVRNTMLPFTFSILNHLGWNGEFRRRSPIGKLSLVGLTLRNIVILISIANAPNAMKGNQLTPLDEPEVVHALAGCVKWIVDLLSWLCDALFCLQGDTKFMSFLMQPNQTQTNQPRQLDQLQKYLYANDEIALHLLLCSSTRNLLSAACRRVMMLDSYSARAVSYYTTRFETSDKLSAIHNDLFSAYRKIKQHTSSALVKAEEFDKFLTTLGNDIRSAYSQAFKPLADREAQNAAKSGQQGQDQQEAKKSSSYMERARQHNELNILLTQALPPPFLGVIAKLFHKDLTELRSHTNVAELYFANYDLLELDDDDASLRKRSSRSDSRIDLFKRTPILKGNGIPWRRCSRCGSVMEDIAATPARPGLVFLLNQQKLCFCGGRFALQQP